jgi:YegS/Rv2252/BmrU family lipid kinase
MTARLPGAVWAIVNPAAGNGRAGRQWPALAERLRAAGIAFTPCVTCGPGDATRCAGWAVAAGAETIVVVGGDGTLNEVVNGCLADGCGGEAGARPALALLPVGTGADFARGLGIGRETMFDALLRGRARAVDVGRVAFRDAAGAERERHFINIADLGLGYQTNLAVRRAPRALGPAAYLYGALASIARYRPVEARVVVDGQPAYDGPVAIVGVANGPFFGGGMHAAPKARHDDGLLDVLVLEGVSRRALIADLLPRVYRGAHLRHPAVHFFRGEAVAVEAATPLMLQADGEGVGGAPARFSVLPRALRVLTPDA